MTAAKPSIRTLISCEDSSVLAALQFSAVLLGYRVESITAHQLLLDGRPLDVEKVASMTGGVAADLYCADYPPDCPVVTDYTLEDDEEFPEINYDLRRWSPLDPGSYGIRVPESAWRIA